MPNQDPEAQPAQARNPLSRKVIKLVAWISSSFTLVTVLVVLAGIVLLHSERFHRYVLATVQQKASDSLGVRVHLQDFAVNLAHLDLDLYGIVVEGAAPYASTHLLEVDHAEAGVGITSWLHAHWYLESLRVDRPIVRIVVDANGISNMPKFESNSSSSSNTAVFDLGVRHAVLDRGEVYYNDRKSLLAADLHDLTFAASFNPAEQKYTGHLSYADGHLVSGSLNTIPHSLQAEFDATPDKFHLTRAHLTSGASQLRISASLTNYSSPIVDGQYDLQIDGAQVGEILKTSSVPQGRVHTNGSLHYQQQSGVALLDAIQIAGNLDSDRLDVRANSLRARVTALKAQYSLEHGNAHLLGLTLDLLGGRLLAQGTMTDIAGDTHSQAKAKLQGISLSELKRLAGPSQGAKDVGVSGALNADLTASWGKSFETLVAHADSTISGNVSHVQPSAKQASSTQPSASNTASNAIPIDAAIHGTYEAKTQQLTLTRSYLHTPQTSLTLNGKVSSNSSLDVRLQADNLREIDTIVDTFAGPGKGKSARSLGLAGTASFQGAVHGSLSAPHLDGQFLSSNLQIYGSSWKVVRASIDAGPDRISIQHGELQPSTHGHIAIDLSAGLTQWAFTRSSPIEANIDAAQIDVAELAKLSGQAVPVTGTLTTKVSLHGTELNPVGQGNLSIASLVAYGQPVSSFKINFAGTGEQAHAELSAQLPGGSIGANVSVHPRERNYTAQLNATGIELSKLQALKASNVDASGEVSLHASGQGTFDNPQLTATLSIPNLIVQKQAISGLNLQASLANHIVNATLASTALSTHLQGAARVELTGDYMADASLNTQSIPLQPLLAVYAPEQAADVSGETELHATLHGPLKNKNLLEAHVIIPTLKLAYGKSIQLAAAHPIHIDYKDQSIQVERTSIQGTDTDLQLQAAIPVGTNTSSMSAMLQGTVNLQLAQLFDPDIRTAGELRLNINSTGTSDVGGKIDIVNASYSSTDLPVGLQNGNGTLTLNGNRLNISRFQGTVGGGTVTAQGGVTLRPSIQFDLGLNAQGIRTLYPQGLREGVDATIRLAGTTDAAVLNGSVNLTDLSFTSAFDLNSFLSQLTGGVSTPPTPGFSQNLQLNLNVRSSNDIHLVSRTLSVDGSANLQVRGTAANPVILGRVNLTDGDIILNGDRFVVNGGTIAFVNPSQTQPVLNVSLKTTIQQYDVYLRFEGPIDQLRTNYNSDPSLPSADIINLLAFGNTTEANAANPSTSTNQAAAGLVASQVSSQVTSRVSKIAGISQLSINPVLAGGTNAGPPGANITIQQRVTGNLFVTFSSNVASTQSQTIQGQYQLSPRVALSVTRDQNGGVAFDTLIKKSW
jgi:translocation and assembly module TamB